MVKLGEIGDFKSGGTPSRSKPEFFEGDIPWITTTSLGKTFIDDTDAVQFITEEAVANSATRIISKNSIMVGVRVGVGKVSINSIPMCTSQDIISIENINEQEIYKPYIVHCIKSYISYFDSQKRGATIQGINSGVLKSLDLSLPPLEIQKQIAKTLDTAAELLGKRKQQLAELENLIKSTFYDMFGDPVTNEKGWDKKDLNEACEKITDGEHVTPQRTEQGIYLLSARNILNHAMQLDDVDFINESEYDRISRRIIPEENDILISCSGSVGRVCRVRGDFKFQMVRSVAILKLKPTINSIFLEYMVDTDYMQNQILRSINQSSQANLFQGKIKKLEIILPSMSLQTQFAEIVTKIEEQKALVKKAIDETQHLFDSLMSEYFE